MKDTIEQLLLQKEYDDLSAEELKIIAEQFPTKQEYDDSRNTLLLLYSSKEENIIPSASVKSALLKRFSQSNNLKVVKNGNEDQSQSRVLIYRLAAAALILAGLFTTFLIFRNHGEKNNTIAEKKDTASKKIQTYQSQDTSTIHSEEIIKNSNSSNALVQNNKQVNIVKKDSINQNNLAQVNSTQTSNTALPKGHPLIDDLALADIMYVAL